MLDKFALSQLFLISSWLALAAGRMCWEDCGGQIVPENVDILDCRRRSTYPEYENFTCDGKIGPPCTVFKDDEVNVLVEWRNPGLTNLKQSIYWDSPVLPLPWIGLDREVCPYLDGGRGCKNTTVAGKLYQQEFINYSLNFSHDLADMSFRFM